MARGREGVLTEWGKLTRTLIIVSIIFWNQQTVDALASPPSPLGMARGLIVAPGGGKRPPRASGKAIPNGKECPSPARPLASRPSSRARIGQQPSPPPQRDARPAGLGPPQTCPGPPPPVRLVHAPRADRLHADAGQHVRALPHARLAARRARKAQPSPGHCRERATRRPRRYACRIHRRAGALGTARCR
jgi:hypothetical protein